MRIIVLLAALLIVAFLIYKQMGPGPGSVQQTQGTQENGSHDVPKIPTNLNEVKKFEAQMNEYIEQQDEKREAEINSVVSQ